MSERRGLGLIISAAALWGTTGTAQALGPPTSDPLGVGLLRLVIAGPALLAVAAYAGFLPDRGILRRYPTLVAAVGMAAYQPAFFTAVRLTGVAMGTVVAIGSAPVLAGLAGLIVDGRRPGRRWWIATALGIAGVALLLTTTRHTPANPAGLLAAVGAGGAFATYIVASRRVVDRSHPVGGMAAVLVVAAVLTLPVLAWVDVTWVATGAGLTMALFLGLVATALAYLLFSIGLRDTPTASAATASLAEPLTATLLGVAILGETPGPTGWLGIAMILAGLLFLATTRSARSLVPGS